MNNTMTKCHSNYMKHIKYIKDIKILNIKNLVKRNCLKLVNQEDFSVIFWAD